MNRKLRNLREEHKFSQNYIAKLLGISQSAYSQIEKGTVAISVEHLKTLCKEYQVSMDWLVLDHGSKTSPGQSPGYIPLVRTSAEAGYLKNHEQREPFVSGLENYKIPGFEDGNYRIFEASANNMDPVVLPQDLLICSYVDDFREVLNGSICVVVQRNSIGVKRVSLGDGGDNMVNLRSDNPNFEVDKVDRESVRELWLVNAKLTSSFIAPRKDQDARIRKLEEEFVLVKQQLQRLI